MNAPTPQNAPKSTKSTAAASVVVSSVAFVVVGLLVLMHVTNFKMDPEQVNVFIALILAAVLSAAYLIGFAAFVVGIVLAIVSLTKQSHKTLPVIALIISLATAGIVILPML